MVANPSIQDLTQSQTLTLLESAVVGGRLAHAIILVGEDLEEQKLVARFVARLIFCKNIKDSKACLECLDCRKLEKDIHPDFSYIKPEENVAAIKVEAIRKLQAMASLKPYEARAKFFVILDAHRMNETAQNAFLKTLEEPEINTYFILITSNAHSFLETIRSRTQVFYFSNKPQAQDNKKVDQAFEEALQFIHLRDQGKIVLGPDLAKEERQVILKMLDQLSEYFRDILLIQLDVQGSLDDASIALSKKQHARLLDIKQTLDRIQIFLDFKQKIAANVNTKLALSVLWEKLYSERRAYAN